MQPDEASGPVNFVLDDVLLRRSHRLLLTVYSHRLHSGAHGVSGGGVQERLNSRVTLPGRMLGGRPVT